MQTRHRFAFGSVLLFSAVLTALPAAAAVSVLGAGLSEDCYKAAEFSGNPSDGIQACTTALREQALSPDDRAATFVNRGILRARTGNPDAALADYNSGLRIRPELAEAYIDRGATYIVMKRYKAALDDINHGLALGANKPYIAYYDRAIVHEALGDIKAAYQDYKKAVELAPNFTLAIQQLQRFKVVRKPAKDGT